MASDPPESCGLLILTALGEELTPLLKRFDARPVEPTPTDGGDRYFTADVPVGGSRTLRVVMASAYGKGVSRMTALTSKALLRWRPRHTILAGIAAAIPDGKTALGTTLVATTIVDASEQKIKPQGRTTRHRSFECDDDLLIPLRCFIDVDDAERSRFGLIICQPDVVKFSVFRDELVEPVRRFFDEEPIGLEMEGAGLAIAIRRYPAAERPSFVLVKGAVDFASFRKNDRHRDQAASVVADLLFGFISKGWLATDPQMGRVAELPAATASPLHLVGRERWMSELLADLAEPAGARVISVEGLGGIGKTALATRVLAKAHDRQLFAATAIYTVSLSDDSEFSSQALVSGLAAQLSYHEVNQLSGDAAASELLQRLHGDPHLILVDNLERPEDVAELASMLDRVGSASRTRWIITSRTSVRAALPSTQALILDELARDDAVAVIEESLRRQRFHAVGIPKADLEAVFDVVGGNPQALKLSSGLLSRYPTQIALHLLVQGRNEADEFYKNIYEASWRLLSEGSRTTIIAMRALPQEGGDWERMLALSGKSPAELMQILRELLDLSLVTASRQGSALLYALHRLTATFVGEVMNSWDAGERDETLRAIRARNIAHTLQRMQGDGELD